MIIRFFLFIIFTISLISCTSNKDFKYEESKRSNPYEIYKEGLIAFEKKDYFFASQKFDEAELNFDKPRLAAKAAIMSSYSLYGINFYKEAEENLTRFLKVYPADNNIIYAHYLLAIIYYEQI